MAALSKDLSEDNTCIKPGIIPWILLEQLAKEIPQQLHNINRFVFSNTKIL